MSSASTSPGSRGLSPLRIIVMMLLGVLLGGATYFARQRQWPLLATLFPSRAHPAATQEPVTGMMSDEILTRGQAAFTECYLRKTGKKTEAAYGDACQAYAVVRAADTDARAATLPAAKRAVVTQAREILTQWAEQAIITAESLAGGGNTYQTMRKSSYAAREDLLGQLSAGLLKPVARDVKARAAAADMIAIIIQTIKDNDGVDFKDVPDATAAEQRYRAAQAQLKQLAPRLEALVKTLPDQLAIGVASYAFDLLSTDEGDSQ